MGHACATDTAVYDTARKRAAEDMAPTREQRHRLAPAAELEDAVAAEPEGEAAAELEVTESLSEPEPEDTVDSEGEPEGAPEPTLGAVWAKLCSVEALVRHAVLRVLNQ